MHYCLGLLKSKKIWLKGLIAGFLGLLGVFLAYFLYAIYSLVYAPMLASTIFEVQPRTSANAFVRTLTQHHWIRHPRLFLLLIRCEGLSAQLKTGFYQMKPDESAQKFLLRVVSGDVLKLPFQIIDGMTQYQVVERMTSSPYLKYQSKDLPGEGALLADTYYYTAGSDGQMLVRQAKMALEDALSAIWAQRSSDLPYHTSYEMLIAASILEKEARYSDERSLIAGVIMNRLKYHMPLQMDPTVIYALGQSYRGRLSHNDLKIDSPYNTYRYRGLPPTPIAMVGKEALLAAAHPQRSDYLYFVARGDGRHVFSTNYEDQKQAIQRYQHGSS